MSDDKGKIGKKHSDVPVVTLLVCLFYMLSVDVGTASVIPVKEWLVIGAFHTSDDNEILDFPYLPEQELAPSPGGSAGNLSWQTVSAETARIDLLSLEFPVKRFFSAYAFRMSWVLSVEPSSTRMSSKFLKS